jgi:flagellar hook-associated protein 1 FlgK
VSLVSLLSIARSALLIHQRAMAVTGNNVANAQTPGYSRQRLEMVEATPLWTPHGTMGRGVDAVTVSRARDIFYDRAFRRESGLLGGASTQGDLLSQLESALGEPGDNGLGAVIDGMFSAFSGLANDPASGTSRMLVRQAATRLVDQFHQTDARIGQLIQDGADRLAGQVEQVNQITHQITALNNQILAAGPNGSPTLEDQRDLLLDQMSSLMSIQVVERPDHTVAVQAGGAFIVDGAQSRDLAMRTSATGGPAIGFVTDPGTIDPGGGSMKALIDLTNTTLPGYRAQLDQLAQNLVTQTNVIHRSGFTLSGATAIDFFDPAGTTAATIQLSASILASPDAIAAGDMPSGGDGGMALRLGDLVRVPLAGLGGRSIRDFYVNVAGSIGIAVSDALQQTSIQQALVDNADSQRQQVSGVSVDEEMVQLIAQQQAYGAAARLVTVANDMIQDLLQMI